MRKLTGFWRHVVTALSVMLVLFQLYTAGFGVFPDIVQRSVHLFFVLTMLFLLMPANKKKKTDTVPWYDVVLSMICMVCTGYMILIYEKILWDPSQWINSFDKICAVLLTILILEGSRRAVGLTFPIMAAFFLFYAAFGQIFPGLWAHKNFSFNQIFQNLYHTTNGIWGQMVGLSAGMLAMFGIFGAILSVTGGSQTFIRLAQKMTGKAVGGPGKVALIASGLFGMVSGSAMANVVATGTFTIPMMKDAGYSKEWSAAISAVGSTGGQIMPPIMGAGAFIMAQLIGLSYLTIAKAAIVPALLYYMGAFVALHYLSKRLKIFGEGCKEKIRVIEFAIIFVPLAVFIAFLAVGYTVTKAAFYATVVSVIVTVFSFAMATKNPAQTAKQAGGLCMKVAKSGAESILSMAGLLAGAQISIALIDDEESVVKYLRKRLERRGYHVDGYTDPEEALEDMVNGRIHWNAVIVDYMMPGIKGTALAQRMKKLQPYLCVIMITGLVDREALELRQDGQIDNILIKPVNFEELVAAIDKGYRRQLDMIEY